ncbi:MAG: VWA domain-containing protein [Rhodospirillales bacterium]|nr:VWA domain-containing protein [Acetobacter sp.]
MKHFTWIFLAIGTVFLASAQLPRPGVDPGSPPPQPGQLGPAPATPSHDNQSIAAPPTAGQQAGVETDENTIRLNIRNILVPTTVLDPAGHGYVNGLSVRDFELIDNDKAQKIASDVVQQPLSVVLAVQANSEVEPLLSTIKKSGVLLQGLVTGQNGDVAILAFDHRMRVMQDFTTDADKLDDAMQKITSGSSTAALVDAVLQSDRMLKSHDRQNVRRRVIILMSRNVNKGSQAKLQETVRAMQFDNVIVYAVDISKVKTAALKQMEYPRPAKGGIPPEAQPQIQGGTPRSETTNVQEMDGNWLNVGPPIFRGVRDLFQKTPAEAFTTFTGGNIYSFYNQRGLEDAITDIGKDLNSQYLLSYSPNQDTRVEPGFHNIRVTVDRPGLKVRTRPGYWWGGGQQ